MNKNIYKTESPLCEYSVRTPQFCWSDFYVFVNVAELK